MDVPLRDDYEKIQRTLTNDDLADAASRGRLSLLVTQPEERLPIRLLQTVQERSSSAIIGRRASATFAMATFSHRLKKFRGQIPNFSQVVSTGADSLNKMIGIDRATSERLLAGPIADYYDALGSLRHNDLKALRYKRGDDAFQFVRAALRGFELPDLELEFRVASTMAGISNLFGAELALSGIHSPLTFPAETIGTLFSYFGGESILDSDDSAANSHTNSMIYPEGPLFAFSETRPLSEILDIVDAKNAAIAVSIFHELSQLSKEAREARIIQINDFMHEYGALPSEKIIGRGMAVRHASWIVGALGLVLTWAGSLPWYGYLVGSAQFIDGGLAFFRDTERLKSLGEDVARSRKQVELLTKIRKVAWLDERRF